MPAINVEIEATIVGDKVEYFPEGTPYYIPAGGTVNPPEGGLNVRQVMFSPDNSNPPDGELAGSSWLMPTGFIVLGATTSGIITGKKVRITIEEIVPE